MPFWVTQGFPWELTKQLGAVGGSEYNTKRVKCPPVSMAGCD